MLSRVLAVTSKANLSLNYPSRVAETSIGGLWFRVPAAYSFKQAQSFGLDELP